MPGRCQKAHFLRRGREAVNQQHRFALAPHHVVDPYAGGIEVVRIGRARFRARAFGRGGCRGLLATHRAEQQANDRKAQAQTRKTAVDHGVEFLVKQVGRTAASRRPPSSAVVVRENAGTFSLVLLWFEIDRLAAAGAGLLRGRDALIRRFRAAMPSDKALCGALMYWPCHI